jgi:hypothetical protein
VTYKRVGILLSSGQEGIGWWVLCLDLVLGVVAYEALYRICPVDTGVLVASVVHIKAGKNFEGQKWGDTILRGFRG